MTAKRAAATLAAQGTGLGAIFAGFFFHEFTLMVAGAGLVGIDALLPEKRKPRELSTKRECFKCHNQAQSRLHETAEGVVCEGCDPQLRELATLRRAYEKGLDVRLLEAYTARVLAGETVHHILHSEVDQFGEEVLELMGSLGEWRRGRHTNHKSACGVQRGYPCDCGYAGKFSEYKAGLEREIAQKMKMARSRRPERPRMIEYIDDVGTRIRLSTADIAAIKPGDAPGLIDVTMRSGVRYFDLTPVQ